MSSQAVNRTDQHRWKAASWVATVAIYLITVGSMATVGVIVPQMGELSRALNASTAELGLAIGLYSLPAALFSIPLGTVIDRLGSKHALLLGAICALCGDALIYHSGTLFTFQIGMAVAGVANAVIITAAPALLMTALHGAQRVRAMSLWSTYGPAGYALGLLIGAPFADSGGWRLAIICLIGLMAVATMVSALVLADPGRIVATAPRPSWRQFGAFFANRAMLRVSLAYGIVAGLSYGSSLAAPGFLARTYGVSMAASATAIAAAKIVAMVLGGIGMGWVLGRKGSNRALFAAICLFAIGAQFILFFPGSGMILATSAMIFWLFAYGAISATSFVTLARINQDPAQAGLAAGLIGQIASLACFVAPSIYFAVDFWAAFVLIAATGLALVILLFPHHAGDPAID